MVEGPPGPGRTAWKAAEAALTLLSAAMARRAIEQFITGEAPSRGSAKQAMPATSNGEPPKTGAEASYTGFSTKNRASAP
jgi:hypothetical protein